MLSLVLFIYPCIVILLTCKAVNPDGSTLAFYLEKYLTVNTEDPKRACRDKPGVLLPTKDQNLSHHILNIGEL